MILFQTQLKRGFWDAVMKKVPTFQSALLFDPALQMLKKWTHRLSASEDGHSILISALADVERNDVANFVDNKRGLTGTSPASSG